MFTISGSARNPDQQLANSASSHIDITQSKRRRQVPTCRGPELCATA